MRLSPDPTLWTCSYVCGIGAADIELTVFDTHQ